MPQLRTVEYASGGTSVPIWYVVLLVMIGAGCVFLPFIQGVLSGHQYQVAATGYLQSSARIIEEFVPGFEKYGLFLPNGDINEDKVGHGIYLTGVYHQQLGQIELVQKWLGLQQGKNRWRNIGNKPEPQAPWHI